jgi:5,6-dimethylbenzimidazole synthase
MATGYRLKPGQWRNVDDTRKLCDVCPITADHVEKFADLVYWRRDVRRFRTDAIASATLEKLLRLADASPSVGNSQPWRIVDIRDRARRSTIRANFEAANAEAASGYSDAGERQKYLGLKLAGFDAAPIHLAVFCENDTPQGRGLGRQTMPEMLAYSCVGMVNTLWLAARAEGIGMGWVSILDPTIISSTVEVPSAWHFIAYLLLGKPEEEHLDPELDRFGWQKRHDFHERFLIR